MPGTSGHFEEAEEQPNPFVLPPDEDIFRMREIEKAAARAERDDALSKSVANKSTFASRMSATVPPDYVFPGANDAHEKETSRQLTLAAAAIGPNARRREKENMAEFIAKKREIFLVQMGLDTKRAEIRKLEERALQREEALKKSEAMLEEDALQFDAFLKENDEKVQEAIKRAEVEVKAKNDKVMEIKRLTAAIAALQSELNKYEELLDDCRKYKDFLDSITPEEWKCEQEQRKAALRMERVRAWEAECERIKQCKEQAKIDKEKAEYDYANARTQQEAERSEQAIKDTTLALREMLAVKEPPPPDDTAPLDSQIEDAMFFDSPHKLLGIYTLLEEQNLFLIQNAQESEEAVEELRTKYVETKAQMDAEVEGLRQQISSLEEEISTQQQKVALLQERTIQNTGGISAMGLHDVTLDELAAKVGDVYARCGFEFDPSLSTQQMLTSIETKLEEYLAHAAQCSSEFVEGVEKAREKDRRRAAREEKVRQQKNEHEERVQRALERAAAPVFRKSGKPVMFRSAPVRKKVVIAEDEGDNDEAELEAFLAREML